MQVQSAHCEEARVGTLSRVHYAMSSDILLPVVREFWIIRENLELNPVRSPVLTGRTAVNSYSETTFLIVDATIRVASEWVVNRILWSFCRVIPFHPDVSVEELVEV